MINNSLTDEQVHEMIAALSIVPMSKVNGDIVAALRELQERRKADSAELVAMTAVPVDPLLTPEAGAAINTLKHLHYTWTGGVHWRPPLGLPPESITGIDYKKLVEEISRIVFGNLDHVEHLPIVIRATFGRYQSCP